MTRFIFAAAAAATLAAAPGFAGSLDAFAADHFNSNVSAADRQSTAPGSVDPALDALALARFNHNASFDEIQPAVKGGTMSARDYNAGSGGYAQLIASAGLTPSEADGMSLGEIAAAKFVNDQTQTEK